MMFDEVIDFVIDDLEGGFANDPNDPGMETKFGISKKSYPDEDILNLTKDRAKFLYRNDFWEKCGGDSMPREQMAIAISVMSCGVNVGIQRANRWMQQGLNREVIAPSTRDLLRVDGKVGPLTRKVLRDFSHSQLSSMRVASYILGKCSQYYADIIVSKFFFRSYFNRIHKISEKMSDP